MKNTTQKINVLKMTRKYWGSYKILPSYQIIISECEISSKSVVHRIVGSLINDGFFDVNADGKLFTLDKFIDYEISNG